MCMQGTMAAELLSVLAKRICIRTLQTNTEEKEQREETLMPLSVTYIKKAWKDLNGISRME